MKCTDCRYFIPIEETRGECHRYPPVIRSGTDNHPTPDNGDGIYPMTHSHNIGCGEWLKETNK